MKKIVHLGLLLTLFLGLVGFISPVSASAQKNYIVSVGAENLSTGVSLMSFSHKLYACTWVIRLPGRVRLMRSTQSHFWLVNPCRRR